MKLGVRNDTHGCLEAEVVKETLEILEECLRVGEGEALGKALQRLKMTFLAKDMLTAIVSVSNTDTNSRHRPEFSLSLNVFFIVNLNVLI